MADAFVIERSINPQFSYDSYGTKVISPSSNPDIEANVEHSWMPSSIFKNPPSPPATLFKNAAIELQDSQPTFIPKFTNLRKICLEHTQRRLRHTEQSIGEARDNETRTEKIEEAACLLQELDSQIKGELKRHELDDPSFAENRGINVFHFALDDRAGHRSGQWMMISQPWGKTAKTIVDQNKANLGELVTSQMQDFAGRDDLLSRVHFKRQKSTFERQPGSVRLNADIGTFEAVPHMLLLWKVIVALAILALTLFFGVGVIATNSTFSALFQKIFFWIAIIWTLTPSVIMAWLVWAIGGTKKDTATVFLASIAIWLVIIQIGQTHLITQGGSSLGG